MPCPKMWKNKTIGDLLIKFINVARTIMIITTIVWEFVSPID